MLFILLFSVLASAKEGHFSSGSAIATGKAASRIYMGPSKAICELAAKETCYDLVKPDGTLFDPEVSSVVGGVVVENPVLRLAKIDAEVAKRNARVLRRQKMQEVLDKPTLVNADRDAALKALLVQSLGD